MRPTAPPAGDLIAEHLSYLARQYRSPQTCRTYRVALRLADRTLGGLAGANTEAIGRWLGRYPSTATRRVYFGALRSFYRWAVAAGHLPADPTAGMRRPPVPRRLPRPCTDRQLQQILAGTTGRVRTWSLIAAYTGARCVEISRLRGADMNADRTDLFGKGDRPRRVPTHPLVWDAVRDLPPGPVAGISAGRLSTLLRAEYLALGVDVTAHQLRHWYGTTLVASGAQIEEVRVLMGHSNIATTLGYVLVASPRLTAAVGRLPDMTC